MIRTDSGGEGNHPQSAEQARQPLTNHSEDRSNSATGSAAVSVHADLAALPSDWRLVRVGRDKAPIAGKGWFDRDNYSPDDAVALNGSSPPAWGLKSGPCSGVVVLDLDALGWRESFQQVTGHPITDLPPTIGWTSGKRDRSGHAFQVDPDWWPHLLNRQEFTRPWREGDPLRNDGTKGAVTLWELRWDRHQAVIIGAHPETGSYRWLPGRSPQEIPDPAPAPDWLLEHLVVQELPEVPRSAPSAADAQRAVALLQCLPQEQFSDYGNWLRIGMALHHTDAGLLTAWVDWCRSMATFDEAECLAKWESFGKAHKGRPATIGTLHHLAKQHGYKEPRRKRTAQQEPRKAAPASAQASAPDTLPASFEQLIQNLPDGWVETEHGPSPSKVRVGEMARLIEGKAGELLRFNEMTMYVEANTSHGWQAVKDAEMDSAYVLLDQKGWITTLESVIKAICHVARQRTIHPVRQYLMRIFEDRTITPYNLDRVAADLFRSKSALHGAMFRKWLIGAAARAMVPGCKMDYCLVLQSAEQGLYKSTALETLASQDWHTSNVPKDDKDFLLNVHSTWIYELAELESVTSKRAAGHMKNLITTRADKFRVPYGRTTETRKRSSVFCGSANTDSFLRDDTGERRYWVVPIEGKDKLDIAAIRQHRDAIWKAALIAHQAGELPMLSAEQEAASEQQNEGYKQQDAWLEMLQAWMGGNPLFSRSANDPTPTPYIDGGTYSPAEILYSAGLKRPDQINNSDATRLGPLLRSLGFESRRVVVGSSKVRRWVKDHPRTTQTTPDHPETVSGGPAKNVAPQSVSANGPPGPPKKNNNGRKETEEAGTIPRPAHGNSSGGLLKQSGGPSGSTAESASVCNGSGWTTRPSQAGGLLGGPEPQNPPLQHHLVELHATYPTAHPSTLVNLLSGKHGISTTVARVRALLEQHDRQAAA